MLAAVVATPATVVVAATPIATSKATIAAVAALLVTGRVLVAQATQTTTILAIASKVAGIATETLLLRMLRLAALALAVLCSGAWATWLGPESRWAWTSALRISKWLQRFFTKSLLASLLLSIRALVRVALRSGEGVLNTSKAASTSCGTWILRSSGS